MERERAQQYTEDDSASVEPEAEPEPETEGGASGPGAPTGVGAGFGGSDWEGWRPEGRLPPHIHNMPIEDLNLSMRPYNCIRRGGIMTLGQLLELSPPQLMSLRNFGRAAYVEVRDRLLELKFIGPEHPIAVYELADLAETEEGDAS